MGFVPCFCRPWGEHVRNGGSLRLLWLITHRGGCKQLWQEHGERHETTGKNTHPRTPHWLPPSLCVLQDLNMSLSAWDSHFPPLLAICSPCCGTLSCLWLQDFHKVARIVYLSLLKKKKTKGKWKMLANWVRLLFRQSSGTVELFSDSCFHFELLRVRSSSETKEMSSSTLPQHANTTSYTSHNSSC